MHFLEKKEKNSFSGCIYLISSRKVVIETLLFSNVLSNLRNKVIFFEKQSLSRPLFLEIALRFFSNQNHIFSLPKKYTKICELGVDSATQRWYFIRRD